MRHHNYLARKVAHEAHAVINHQAYHQRDVIPSRPVSSSAADSPTPSVASSQIQAVNTIPSTWKAKTAAACMTSLAALNGKASNPSGLAACYNIASWNSSTGIFEADLQLYRIAAATGDWMTLMTQAVNVGLSYSSATVAPTGGNRKRSQESPSQVSSESQLSRASYVPRAAAAATTMIQEMTFVGKINKDMMNRVNETRVIRSCLYKMSFTDHLVATKLKLFSPRVLLFLGPTRAEKLSPRCCLQARHLSSMVSSPTRSNPPLRLGFHRHRRLQMPVILSCQDGPWVSFPSV